MTLFAMEQPAEPVEPVEPAVRRVRPGHRMVEHLRRAVRRRLGPAVSARRARTVGGMRTPDKICADLEPGAGEWVTEWGVTSMDGVIWCVDRSQARECAGWLSPPSYVVSRRMYRGGWVRDPA